MMQVFSEADGILGHLKILRIDLDSQGKCLEFQWKCLVKMLRFLVKMLRFLVKI